MPPIFYIVLAVIFAIVLISITISLVCSLKQKKYRDFVLQYSVCLKQLDEINRNYNFYPFISFDQSHTYDNEKFYNSISCQDYLIYQLQYIRKNLITQIEKVNTNKQLYSKYTNEVNSITQFGQFQSFIGKLRMAKLIEVERLLMKNNTYSTPVTQFSLTVTLYCAKINGQIYSRKSESFSADDIYILTKRLNNKNGYFYNDRAIWDALCRVERGKVSNKMRFSIYERDRYRCRKCGVSNRYTQLEIDHIIPIAKGGKTVYENLQTLCHRCNVEKGDTY